MPKLCFITRFQSQRNTVENNQQVSNASLIFKHRDITRHIILLPGQEVFFGRDKTNDVKLALFPLEELAFQWATADISRRHFVVRKKNGSYNIQDFGSTNGTSVNCIALLSKEMTLQQKQTIDVGGVLDLEVKFTNDKSLWLQRLTNTPEESYLLFNDAVTIGTSTENTICVENSSIQSNHAKIIYEDGKYLICGCNQDAEVLIDSSSFATPQTPIEMESGMRITLEDVEILFKTFSLV